MNHLPLVSVIIPVYNGEHFLAEAIQNLKRQHYPQLEIIVIDDGSTDKTAEIAAQFHADIRYIYQSNQGPAAARNHGINLAQGEVITFLDVDDLWADQVLIEFTSYLIAHPEVEIVQGLIQQMQLDPTRTDRYADAFKPIFEPYQFINLGSAIYRKSVFDKVGLFDPELRDNEDTDWFMRAWEQNIHKVVMPKVMLFYRQHGRNMVLQQTNLVHFGLLKIFKRHIARKRSQGTSSVSPSMHWLDYSGQSPI
ncbi:glycosyltransferase [Leptolyngbya boryana CZ1]|uniref:Glycosyltransferase n=1 Tax=Leptolyngbya boryana CZ1 TaxID=3060204 RepID=A0AA96WX13_LEPBY|nr:glycosyltransferase [Leptolyngbya boryana]WNZ46986.1 glycosyltransferase [Leptolyngbya boryana CZ1]